MKPTIDSHGVRWFSNEDPKSPNATQSWAVAHLHPTGEPIALTSANVMRGREQLGRNTEDVASAIACVGRHERRSRTIQVLVIAAIVAVAFVLGCLLGCSPKTTVQPEPVGPQAPARLCVPITAVER